MNIHLIAVRTRKDGSRPRYMLHDVVSVEQGQAAILNASLELQKLTEGSRVYAYKLALASELPAYAEARKRSGAAWAKTCEADIFPTADEMTALFGVGN